MATWGLLMALFLLGGDAADLGTRPPLPCQLLGPGGAVEKRPALLRLGGGAGTPPDPDDTDRTFDVTDPWGTLTKVWGPPWTPPKCELSPTEPGLAPPAWAPTLGPRGHSPPGPGGPWWLLTLGTPNYGVTALLQGGGAPHAGPTPVTATLSVFTLTPTPGGRLGTPLDLHCAFASPPGPFALEWRHRHRGAGRRLLAYDSAASRVADAAPGAHLLLGGDGDRGAGGPREVTLRLDPLAVAHHGAHVCTVFVPHGAAQQLLRLSVLEPPEVTLSPSPLVVAPGVTPELRCDATGFFPLDVAVRWKRRAAAEGTPAGDAVAETWSSGHHRRPDGTYGRSSGARLVPARPRHHGDVVTCEVTHPALGAPRRLRVRLEVAGVVAPAVEDIVGLCLVTFVLCGLWRWLSPPPLRPDEDPKKSR